MYVDGILYDPGRFPYNFRKVARTRSVRECALYDIVPRRRIQSGSELLAVHVIAVYDHRRLDAVVLQECCQRLGLVCVVGGNSEYVVGDCQRRGRGAAGYGQHVVLPQIFLNGAYLAAAGRTDHQTYALLRELPDFSAAPSAVASSSFMTSSKLHCSPMLSRYPL